MHLQTFTRQDLRDAGSQPPEDAGLLFRIVARLRQLAKGDWRGAHRLFLPEGDAIERQQHDGDPKETVSETVAYQAPSRVST